jgi:uncharacterized protein (DUF362 family)
MKTPVVVSACPAYEKECIDRSIHEIFSYLAPDIALCVQGKRILIKPNLLMADLPKNGTLTHPHLIEGVILFLQKRGASVAIGDSPAFGSAQGVAKACGLERIAKHYKVPIISFARNKNIYRRSARSSFLSSLSAQQQRRIKSLSSITKSISEYDYIINMPKLKVHTQMGFTGATKNLYGFISGKAKVLRHFLVDNDIELFSLFILHILERVQPEFTIVDAVQTLERQGPRHGDVVNRGVLIGGKECVAIDRVITELVGCDLRENVLAHCAEKYNVLFANLESIEIINPTAINLRSFKLRESQMQISFSSTRVLKSLLRHLLVRVFEKK